MKTVTLANGLLVNGTVIEQVDILKLGGAQEDLIRSEKVLESGDSLGELLKTSITRIGNVTDPGEIGKLYESALKMPDQQSILIALRIHGIGKTYRFPHKCPACKKKSGHTFDLTTLRFIPQPEEYKRQTEYFAVAHDEETGEPDVPFKFRGLMAKDAKMLTAIRNTYPDDRATRELSLQILEVNGQPADWKVVKALPWVIRNAMRVEMDKVVGGHDIRLIIPCGNPECRDEYEAMLPVGTRDFFYPAAVTGATLTPARTFLSSGTTPPSSGADGTGSQSKSENSQ